MRQSRSEDLAGSSDFPFFFSCLLTTVQTHVIAIQKDITYEAGSPPWEYAECSGEYLYTNKLHN